MLEPEYAQFSSIDKLNVLKLALIDDFGLSEFASKAWGAIKKIGPKILNHFIPGAGSAVKMLGKSIGSIMHGSGPHGDATSA